MTVNGVPDMRARLSTSSANYQVNVPMEVFFEFSNVGSTATSGAITVYVYKPSVAGTFTVAAPVGWSLTNTTNTYFAYTYTGVMQPNDSGIFTGTYTRTATGTGTLQFRGVVVPGSGGETNNTNNSRTVAITLIQ